MNRTIDLAERGLLPDALLRLGIRRLCARRLADEEARDARLPHGSVRALVSELRKSPIALVPEKANEQHYAEPSELFRIVLGPRLKYSCAFWPPGVETLAAAEDAMLALTCRRAGLEDGMRILELGCGWGSLSLWMAERFPAARIVAVSNSHPQRRFIEEEAARRGLANLDVRTADVNEFDPSARFDRVVSVEMFEHLRNYEAFLARVAGWLRPEGRLFVHVFCHRLFAYPFENTGEDDWMARHFFSGGLMPSEDLFLHFQHDLELEERWRVSGTHYRRTAEAWLGNLDRGRDDALRVLSAAHGGAEAARRFGRWRLFFLACAELFGYREGREWCVSHQLFRPR